MVTIVKADLEKRVFVDKAETMLLVGNSTLEVSLKEYNALRDAVRAGRARDKDSGMILKLRNSGGFIMQSAAGGKIIIGVGDGESENIVLTASWNPQTWFSGQNVVPGVCSRSGEMLMGLADIVEYPFKKLMELSGRRASLVHNNVNYGRLDFTSYTAKLSEDTAEDVLKFFTSTCAKQEYSRKDRSMIGISHMLGFGFTMYSAGELVSKKGLGEARDSRLCGIVFKKYVGAAKHKAFTLSIYDKTVEVEDKVAALRDPGKKPKVLENNQIIMKQLKDELSGRLRVEGQVYPDTFLRGLAARFRSLMMREAEKPEWVGDDIWSRIQEGQKMKTADGKVVPDSYYRKSEFLRASGATEGTLRLVLQEMTRQLGLPVIFEAPSQKTFMRRVREEVEKFIRKEGREEEVRGLMKDWEEGKDVSERALNTISLPYKLRSWFMDSLGVDLFSCDKELPRMIRGALMTSTLSNSEQQDYIHGDSERILELKKLMLEAAKELRGKMKAIPSSPAIAKVSW